MANLAILGHATRGNEVIEILEMLGGKNKRRFNGENNCLWHFINERGEISVFTHVVDLTDNIFLTLEEFLEKFPYKVGDKVIVEDCISPYTINDMIWEDDTVKYRINCEDDWLTTDELQPYKEEIMEEKRIEIPAGYEFAGVDDNAQQVVFTKIQPQYPKTYKECFNICFGNHHPVVQVVGLDGLGGNKALFERFIKLKICRDAYWKIAGEQMGLGKPWKPTWNGSESCYCIFCYNGEILEDEVSYGNTILAFPIKEIRDAFKENFDDDIEFCKEFL